MLTAFQHGLIASVAALSAATQTFLPTTVETIERGRVLRQPVRPDFVSGIVAVWVALDVEDGGGERHRLYLLYMRPDQFIPPIGSICRIAFHRAYIEGFDGVESMDGTRPLKSVDTLACDTGSYSGPDR